MSKLGCPCGHTISDTTDSLPYKGDVLPDEHHIEFFEVADQIASYIQAARTGATSAWLKEQGFAKPYIDLKLSDADIVNDLIHTRFLRLIRSIYECEACGRIHIETSNANRFRSYAPDNGAVNSILTTSPSEERN